ncbi:MAG: hypothetical protein HUK20_05115 [Fibrobacter sp.]|nr:hypothetical protein [Fibrobacter sp.]
MNSKKIFSKNFALGVAPLMCALMLAACGYDSSASPSEDCLSSSSEESSFSSKEDGTASSKAKSCSSAEASSSISSSAAEKSSSSSIAPSSSNIFLEPCENGKTSEYKNISVTCQNGKWYATGIEFGTLTDTRDGQTYKTVTIGTQTWMAENLNYDNSASTPILLSGETYGRLYTWAVAMNLNYLYNNSYANDLVQTKHQGICPEGWHVPNNTEWGTLNIYVDSLDGVENNAGYWLKTRYGWNNYDGAPGNGIDGVGFSALPSGYRDFYNFNDLGSYAYFWSASEGSYDYSAHGYYLGSGYSFLGSSYYKFYDRSVRCLQD